MNTFYKLSTLLLCSTMLLSSCAKDDRPDNGGTDTGSDTGEVREVVMTFRNQLVIPKAPTKADGSPQATKAKTIATAAENTISTLDVYVFGAKPRTATIRSRSVSPTVPTLLTSYPQALPNCN